MTPIDRGDEEWIPQIDADRVAAKTALPFPIRKPAALGFEELGKWWRFRQRLLSLWPERDVRHANGGQKRDLVSKRGEFLRMSH